MSDFRPISTVAKSLEDSPREPSRGLTTTDGNQITTSQPGPTHRGEAAEDILSKMLSLKPWLIKPEEKKAATTALRLWDSISRTTDKPDIAYWIGQLLAHFPRRDELGDSIILRDLTTLFDEEGISIAATILTYRHFVKAATADNPFFPPAGEILSVAKGKHDGLVRNANKIKAIVGNEPIVDIGREWYQQIVDRKTDQVLGEYREGSHLSPFEISQKYGIDARVSMRKG